MILNTIARWTDIITESVLFPSRSTRKRLAFRYLRGTGLEIGALQHPLEVPAGVAVTYVDYASREENIKKYPGIDPARIVATDHIEDGFELSGIPAASQDFIIANHVLEHCPNPLQALLNWERVLRKNGILFITLPNGRKSFDYGRAITTFEHMAEDYELVKAGDLTTFAARNREHYREFVEISIPNLHKVQRNLKTYRTEEERNAYIDKLSRQASTDAHFHVFTKSSLVTVLNAIIADYAQNLTLREIARSGFGFEYVVILEKSGSIKS